MWLCSRPNIGAQHGSEALGKPEVLWSHGCCNPRAETRTEQIPPGPPRSCFPPRPKAIPSISSVSETAVEIQINPGNSRFTLWFPLLKGHLLFRPGIRWQKDCLHAPISSPALTRNMWVCVWNLSNSAGKEGQRNQEVKVTFHSVHRKLEVTVGCMKAQL